MEIITLETTQCHKRIITKIIARGSECRTVAQSEPEGRRGGESSTVVDERREPDTLEEPGERSA